jgi:hypothetical protein
MPRASTITTRRQAKIIYPDSDGKPLGETGTHIDSPPLQGYRLRRGRYTRIKAETGRLPSEVLGLHLEPNGLDLRLYNPRTGCWVPTSEEIDTALRDEEAARRRAQEEAAQLRQEVDRLRKKLQEG